VKTIDTLKAYIKFGTKLFHFMKCKPSDGKNEKKVNLGVLGVSP
jgi:hypothetical protein